MKFEKALMDMYIMEMTLVYVTIWGYTKWRINNINYIIITLDYPWDTEFTNSALEIHVTFQNDDKVDDECNIITLETAY